MNILLLIISMLGHNYIVDFSNSETNTWTAVNDGVMGGLSEGNLTYTDGSVIFEGELSLANNGGFASFQSPQGGYDLSKYSTVTIKHRGYGGTFGFRLKTSEPFYTPYYKAEFNPAKEWQESTFRLSDFAEWRLSDKTGGKIAKDDLAKIIRMGIIKSDKKEASFLLELDFIKFE